MLNSEVFSVHVYIHLLSFFRAPLQIPPIKNMVVELNGVLVTHALITLRELSVRCAQHYSWWVSLLLFSLYLFYLCVPDFSPRLKEDFLGTQ